MNLREVGLRLPLPAPTASPEAAARGGDEAFSLPTPEQTARSRTASMPARGDAARTPLAAERLRDARAAANADRERMPEAGSTPPADAPGGSHRAASGTRPDRSDEIPSSNGPPMAADPAGSVAAVPQAAADVPTDRTPPATQANGAREPVGAAPAEVTLPAAWLAAMTPATAAAGPTTGSAVAPSTLAPPAAPPAGTAAVGPSPPGTVLPGMTAAGTQAVAVPPMPPPSPGGISGSGPSLAPASAEAAHGVPLPSSGAVEPTSSVLDPAASATVARAPAHAPAPVPPLGAAPPTVPTAAGPEAFAALVALSTQAGRPAAVPEERGADGLSALAGLDSTPPTSPAGALPGTPPLRAAESSPVVVPGTVALPASPEAGFDDAFGDKVVWIVEQRLTQAEMRVSPDGLGSIEVRLQLEGHKLSAQFGAAHPDVRQALEAGMGRLRDLLGQHGMELADSHVGQQHGGGDRPPTRHARAEDADGDRPALVTTLGGLRARGLIDLYA